MLVTLTFPGRYADSEFLWQIHKLKWVGYDILSKCKKGKLRNRGKDRVPAGHLVHVTQLFTAMCPEIDWRR